MINKLHTKKIIWLLSIFILVGFMLSMMSFSTEATQKVRVGYFPLPRFHEYDKNGKETGYDVEYLKTIAQYTNWEYEYVNVDTWGNALKLLREGKIDLLGSAQMVPERMEDFSFTTYSTGVTFGAVMASSENNDVAYEEYDAFNKARIGCVKDYVRKNEFLEYSKENKFMPELIYFENNIKLRAALHRGEIDLMVSSVMERTDEEKIVGRFSYEPFYYITQKNNIKLISELNDAISKINLDIPNFQDKLFDKYYADSKEPQFTREELDYLETKPTVTVASTINHSPLSSYDENKKYIVGITPDILAWIENKSGIAFELIDLPVGEVSSDYLQKGEVDLVSGMLASERNIKNPNIVLTLPYVESNITIVTKKGKPFSQDMSLRIAVPSGFKSCEEYVKKKFPHFLIVNFDTTEECIEAVDNEKVDGLAQDIYILNELLVRPKYRDLTILPNLYIPIGDCLGAKANINPLLISIINKTIQKMPESTKNQIVVSHTYVKSYVPTLSDFWLEYRIPITVIILILCFFFVALYYAFLEKKINYQLVRKNQLTLHNITNNINGGVITLVPDNNLIVNYANDGFLELVGYTREEFAKNQTLRAIARIDEATASMIRSRHTQGEQISLEFDIQRKDDSSIPVLMRGTLSKDENGGTMLFCVIVDISPQRKMIEELQTEKERYHFLIAQSDSMLFDIDFNDHTSIYSPLMLKRIGKTAVDWENRRVVFDDIVHPDDIAEINLIKDSMKQKSNFSFKMRIRTLEDKYIWCRLNINLFHEMKVLKRIIGKIEDIDFEEREKLYLKKVSSRDNLTKLYNRDKFQNRVEYSLSRKKSDTPFALYFLDLDGFKAVNDKFGHAMGDQALVDTADVLRETFRNGDILGRFGGDEFYVFILGVNAEVAQMKAEQLCSKLQRNYGSETGEMVTISASIGVIVSNGEKDITFDEMVKHADVAQYSAKNQGKNRYVIYKED